MLAVATTDFSIECIDFAKPAMRAILQSSATLDEAIGRLDKLVIGAYALPVTRHRIVVVVAGEPEH